ncbi:hypothetical protein ACJMK2_044332 [Sinanodonta woodiana]|uniref:Protein-tyrosine-phosphatase n=1 Tax=Sinanodonta woodiana TaxID=1069815 RepID=A0ABD3W134_SINWO
MEHTIMWFLFILSVWLGFTGTQGISIYPGVSGEILPGVQDQDQQMPNLLLNPREEVPLNLDQSGKEVEEPEVDQGSKRYDMPDTEYIQNHTSRSQSGKIEGEPSTRRVDMGLKEQDVHYRTTVKAEDRQNSSADIDGEASGFGQARLNLHTLPHQESEPLRSPSTSRLELIHGDINEHPHITEHPARGITERPPIENTPKPQKESTEQQQRPTGYFSSKKTEIPIEQTEHNVTETAVQQRHVHYLTEPSLNNFTVADRTLPNPRIIPAQPDSFRTLPTPREQVVQTYRKTTSNRPTENGHGSLRTLPAPEEIAGEGNRTMSTPSGVSSLTIRTLPTPSDVHKTVQTLPNPNVTEEPVTQPELARTAKFSGTTTIGRLHQLTTGATEILILTNISPTPVQENGQAGNSDGHGDNSGEDKDSGKYEPGEKVVDKDNHETVYISSSSIAQHRGKYYATTTTVSSLGYTKSSSVDEHSRSSNVLLSSRIVELPTLLSSEHIQMLQSHSYPWKESSINTKYVTSSTVPIIEPSLVHVSLPSSLHTTSEKYVPSTGGSTFTHNQGTVSFNVSLMSLGSSFPGPLSVTSSVHPMPHVTPDVELLHTSIPIVSHKTQTFLTPFLLNTKLSTHITFSSTPSSSSKQPVFVLSHNPTLSASVVHNLPNGSHDLILNENQTHSTAVPASPTRNTTTPITPTVKKKSDSLSPIQTTSKSELNRTERTNISTALTTKGKVVVLSTKPNNQMTPFRFSSSVTNIRTTGASTTARHHNDVNQPVATSLPNATSPPVFITVVLRMTSFDFCAVKTLFKEDLQRVISENGHTVHDEQIVIISNIADKTCLLPDNNSQQQVTETTIYFYFVDSEGKLDVLSTTDYGKLLESGFRANTAHFRDKLLSVKLIQLENKNGDVKSSEQSISQTYPAEMQPGITMVVVIASVGGICCVALVALQAVLVYRRNGAKKMHPHMLSRSSVRSMDSVALGVLPKSRPNSGYWNPALEQNESGTTETKEYCHLLNYSGLSDFCQDINKIYEEFKTIPNEMPGMTAVPYGAEEKNRFANVIPHPHTRVRLKKNPGDDASDYINANYVTGYKDDHSAYIATQAPMVNTVEDFWRMVWEQQSRAILMLTPMNVIGQPVCNTYWPDSEGMDALRKYGDFTIALRRKDVQQEYTELVLEMKDLENNLLREIHHFWFTNWPSNSEPDPLSVVKFVLDTRPHYEDSGAPVIVHCSPGTGRTGTFIAVDISMRMFEDKRKVDIRRCVYKMRQERAGVVQTKEQYALIYRFVEENLWQPAKPQPKHLVDMDTVIYIVFVLKTDGIGSYIDRSKSFFLEKSISSEMRLNLKHMFGVYFGFDMLPCFPLKLRPTMAALEEGQQYGLSSNSGSCTNKSVVHFKLTDSALKAIEEYLKSKSVSGQKPSIQFQGNHGVIQIPSKNGAELRTFQFTLSAIQGDPNGSFDCVQQPDTKYGHQLRLEGTMSHKVSVHATSDVFEVTKEKMKQAEVEYKDVCTQFIKQSGPHISRRVKTVIRDGHLNSSKHQPISQPTSSKPKPSNPHPSTNITRRPSPSSSHGHSLSPLPPPQQQHPVSSTSYPKSASPVTLATTSSQPKPSANAAVMKMPYRDRIIHLLAVRPYKKPELILRLQKDGTREKDKHSLSSILLQVAQLNTKDNSYHLAKHIYNEVKLEWPFYSEDDRQLLKKKLQSACSPASSPATSNPESPISSSTSQPQKRVHEEPVVPHAMKKPRISHFEKLKKENKPINGLTESDKRDVTSTTGNHDSQSHKENITVKAIIEASSTSDTPEYITKYTRIVNQEQRHVYKADFNNEYEEYRELHANVEKVSQKFAELEVLIRNTHKGTVAYENLKDRIHTEYYLQKSDPKFVEQKKRFEFLHGKLAHIKQLILEYDQMQTGIS